MLEKAVFFAEFERLNVVGHSGKLFYSFLCYTWNRNGCIQM